VLALLELLQTHHRLGGEQLAERLGVDARTVRRYASRLQELGIPVHAERGRYGGYRLLPGYKLPPLMLTGDEAVAVVLGLLAGERLGLATAAPAVESALAKIQRVLPAALREQTTALQETLGFTLTRRESAAPTTDVLLVIGEATRLRRQVRIRYRSYQGEATERDVDPYGVVFHHGRWYLAGHDHRRGEIRTFRLDRMAAAELGGATFDEPDGFDPIEHVTRSLARVPYAWEVEVVLETTLAEARRRLPASTGTLTETDGGVLLRARAERLDGMAQLLAGFGWPFTIRAPTELRAAVRDLAARMATYADRRA
jgi:predicted DNA-binding transcriptional regulator YafY